MNIGIIGTGNMGKALIGGLLKTYNQNISICAFDLNESAYSGLPPTVKVSHPQSWFEQDSAPDAIVISVKPADVTNAINTICSVGAMISKSLLISIAAGVSIASLEKLLPAKSRVCRVMPNTPALISEGISAISMNKYCSSEDNSLVHSIFKACGKAINVPEKMMNAVTGLSGSGPAYVFLFIEAMIEGGISAGLTYDAARECALQTIIGATRMVLETGESPAVLKSKVMSPAGTTASGLLALEKNGFKYSVISAILEATKKSEQLGI
ncbi:MAG: pyrroline-5-carboxylate reductase [Fibrobacter sp.]|jgi:pyrroline-5-carboxylate reductase|nr:pyrroline-5-carboxylate reductase [Fibrobacter sp.]